ncbi:hypothetical protein Thiowin_04974 [Thiorhodovibrio winogradskyi]|uniref:Uncharacterized protein n=1 Tax=Thiorhodovibrio winogradskyi TaxID=77007 RepID=A0ABZ0SIW6_9GAMM|nr:hypothetical protein [Thiorhodovibrio winogradskyi]
MARLTESDRAAFRRLRTHGWVAAPEERAPAVVAATPEARLRYCQWATQAARFYRGEKPVRFGGNHWLL